MKGVIYARYSSDGQREESIEGQIRVNNAFAEKNGIEMVGTYIDRADSAKTDMRPNFLQMIKDSTKRNFEVVIAACTGGNGATQTGTGPNHFLVTAFSGVEYE